MRDAIYILVTVAFFGLMIRYVEWCQRLGQGGAEGEERPWASSPSSRGSWRPWCSCTSSTRSCAPRGS